jgi:hypothetical protein
LAQAMSSTRPTAPSSIKATCGVDDQLVQDHRAAPSGVLGRMDLFEPLRDHLQLGLHPVDRGAGREPRDRVMVVPDRAFLVRPRGGTHGGTRGAHPLPEKPGGTDDGVAVAISVSACPTAGGRPSGSAEASLKITTFARAGRIRPR